MENTEPSLDNLRAITGYAESRVGYDVRLAEDAYEYTAMLNQESRSGKHIDEVRRLAKELIDGLNEGCPYTGRHVIASGDVLRGVVDFDESSRVRERYRRETISNMRVKFYGYTAREPGANNGWQIVQVLLLEDEEVSSYSRYMMSKHVPVAYADMGDLNILYDQPMDELIVGLQNSIPDIMEEVDAAIFSDDDDVTIIQNLGRVRVQDIYPDIPVDDLRHLGSYINKAMDFDQNIPYLVGIKNSYLMSDESGEYGTRLVGGIGSKSTSFGICAYVDSVEILTYTSGDGRGVADSEMHIAFKLKVVDDEAGEAESNPYYVTVLAKDLASFQSLRSL